MKLQLLGTTTHYQQIGTGLPLVLLHGWGCDWQIWSPVISPLSEKYQLIIPDLPVLGQSSLPSDDVWDSFQYSTWLNELLNQLIPNTPFILAGHSFGGKIASIYAAEYPSELLKGLIIIDSAGLPVKLSPKEQFTQSLAQLIPQSVKKTVGSKIKKLLLNQLNIATDYQQANEQQQAVLRKIVREDISHELAQISLPSLVVWGKEDQTTPLEKGELFAELLSDATLKVFDKSGHYPFIDESELFVETVNEYISQQV